MALYENTVTPEYPTQGVFTYPVVFVPLKAEQINTR